MGGVEHRKRGKAARQRGWVLATAAAALLWGIAAGRAAGHPINMSCVEHRFQVRVAPDKIDVAVFLRYYEFPSMTQRRRMDLDRDGTVADAEITAYGKEIDDELARLLVLVVNGQRLRLRSSYPPVIDLEDDCRVVPCHHVQWSLFSAPVAVPAGRPASVSFETKAFPDNDGFFHYEVVGEATTILTSSVVEQPEFDANTSMPASPEIRRITFTYLPQQAGGEAAAGGVGTAREEPPAPSARRVQLDTFMVGLRIFRQWASAYFEGEFSLWGFLVVMVAAYVYGGLHAVAPGHAKTITAAYLIGAQATRWHAVLLGIVVTVSHTWSILVLAVVTHLFYGGEVPSQTHGIVMAASGGLIVLLGLAQFVGRLRGRSLIGHHHGPGGHTHGADGHTHGADGHTHGADGHTHGADGHTHGLDGHSHVHVHGEGDHRHDAHDHSAGHHDDGHGHGGAAAEEAGDQGITVKSLVFLGFSGGIVPCPGALWIYFLALSLHRTFEGIMLIAALGAGLATVLTAIGLLTVRVRRSLLLRAAGEEGQDGRGHPRARKAAAWVGRQIGLIAPCIIAALGLLLVIWGLLSAGVIGGP